MPQKSLTPLFTLAGGFVWYAALAWIRTRPWFKNSGEPGAVQNLLLLGALGLLFAMVAAGVMAFRLWK
jgi:hypothetical protein